MRLTLRTAILLVALGLIAGERPAQAETRRELSVFGGILTDNPWEEVVFTPWNAKYEEPGLIGVAAHFRLFDPLSTRMGEFSFWLEPQVVRHFNLQSNWEFNLPVVARLETKRPFLWVIDSFAFGIGPSHASKVPAFEAQRGDGEAVQNLIYWHFELAHDLDGEADRSVFLRLHHRSDGYGLIGPGASSNGVVVGLRSAF